MGRIDADALGFGVGVEGGKGGQRCGPALDELEGTAIAQEDAAEGEVAALGGVDGGGREDGLAGEGFDALEGGGGDEGGVEVVEEAHVEDGVGALEDGELDAGGLAELWVSRGRCG